jgi:hypothetical protein
MSKKQDQIKQATKVGKTAKKRVIKRKYKIRNQLRFFRPKTFMLASKPKYARSTLALKMPDKFDKFSVLINPINS